MPALATASRSLLARGLVLALAACGEGDDDDSTADATFGQTTATATATAGDDAPAPVTAMECYNEYLFARGDVCISDCNEVLTCVDQFECVTCTSQCMPPSCTNDSECQQQFGHLCPGVTWICDQYQLALACTVDFASGGEATTEADDSSDDADTSSGCAGGNYYECQGDDRRDCGSGDIVDCDELCVLQQYPGAADPGCGVGAGGYDDCLCEGM